MKFYKFKDESDREQFYEDLKAAAAFVAGVIFILYILVLYERVFNY